MSDKGSETELGWGFIGVVLLGNNPVTFFILVDSFGYKVTFAINLALITLIVIWLKLSGKGIFRKDEDKPDEEA